MSTAFKIGFFSDTHIGYAAKVRTHAASGMNERVRDGMKALRETVTQMIEEEVDLAIQGGDLFHRSWPQIAEVVYARRELERLTAAGIPVIVNTGNHDASAERGKSAATAAVNDPERGIEAVIEPYKIIRPVDGLTVHALSHYGLARAERLVPEPVDGDINIFTGHGTALVPGHEIFACADSPGEQPIGLDILSNDGFAASLLGHFHGQGSLPNLPTVWYAGSALRRGFSDPAGGRGWLLVEIDTSGQVTITPKFIHQRPQFDLPVIDGAGLTGVEVRELVMENLAKIDTNGAIIRQVMTNITAQHRAGLDLPGLGKVAPDALQWSLVPRRPEDQIILVNVEGENGETTTTEEGMASIGSSDLPTAYRTWVTGWSEAADVPESLRDQVAADGEEHLKAVTSPDALEDGNADLKNKDNA